MNFTEDEFLFSLPHLSFSFAFNASMLLLVLAVVVVVVVVVAAVAWKNTQANKKPPGPNPFANVCL